MEKKEKISLILGIVLMTLMLSLFSSGDLFNNVVVGLIISLIIIPLSLISKKIIASKIDVKVTQEILQFKRYWITRSSEFKNPIPLGMILPLLISFLSLGTVNFFGFFQFKSEALASKVTKRYGLRRFSTVMDWDEALIVFYSCLSLIVLAIVCVYLPENIFKFHLLAKTALAYLISNIIPFGQLDGMKLFMGSRPLYVLTLILIAITALFIFI